VVLDPAPEFLGALGGFGFRHVVGTLVFRHGATFRENAPAKAGG
jgi:hypothetical protein